MSADDLHVAQFVTWWNEKSDWAQRKPPARTLTCFDDNRCYDVMAGGVNRAGSELLYFNLPAPLRLAQTSGDYPPEMRRLEKARETVDAWVDLDRALFVGPADVGRPGPGRFDRGPQQPLRPTIAGRGRRRRQAAGSTSSIAGPAATPVGRRTSIFACWSAGCGFRPAPGAARASRRIPSATTAFTFTLTATSVGRRGGRIFAPDTRS